MNEPTLTQLQPQRDIPAAERELALRHAPVLRLDAREPFRPVGVGYSLVRRDSSHCSSETRRVAPTSPAVETVIEYSVWWDWGIGHLGNLRRARVALDAAGRTVAIEADAPEQQAPHPASWTALAGGRPQLFVEPGTHVLVAAPGGIDAGRSRHACTRQAGRYGVLTSPEISGLRDLGTPPAERLVHSYLESLAFEPSFDFSQPYPITESLLVPWPALRDWIPQRARWWLAQLETAISPDRRRFLRIAHRGASAHAPENTLAAFEKAADLGADMVEMDVHLSADGVPVVVHDTDLGVVSSYRGNVYWLTVEDLQKLDVGDGRSIPTLDEAITCCIARGVGTYLEIKNGAAVGSVVKTIQTRRLHATSIVASFRPDWLAEVKRIDPDIRTSVLFGAVNVDPIAMARAVGADYVHPAWEWRDSEPHRLLSPKWIRDVQAAGIGVISWHEERPAEVAALKRLGLDGICSNAPELLR
jgi:glycerophosphoryl diester phosphodiesterase